MCPSQKNYILKLENLAIHEDQTFLSRKSTPKDRCRSLDETRTSPQNPHWNFEFSHQHIQLYNDEQNTDELEEEDLDNDLRTPLHSSPSKRGGKLEHDFGYKEALAVEQKLCSLKLAQLNHRLQEERKFAKIQASKMKKELREAEEELAAAWECENLREKMEREKLKREFRKMKKQLKSEKKKRQQKLQMEYIESAMGTMDLHEKEEEGEFESRRVDAFKNFVLRAGVRFSHLFTKY